MNKSKKMIIIIAVMVVAIALLTVVMLVSHNRREENAYDESAVPVSVENVTQEELDSNPKIAKHAKKKGHSFRKEILVAVTCTEDGRVRYVCNDCGYTVNTNVKSKGHTEIIDAAKEPTCQHTGLTEGKHCSVCGEVLVARESLPVADHKYNKKGVCVWCGAKKGSSGSSGSGSSGGSGSGSGSSGGSGEYEPGEEITLPGQDEDELPIVIE